MKPHAFARVATAALVLLSPAVAAWGAETNCSDGVDDDLDGRTDCADSDCALDAACVVSVTRDLSVVRRDPLVPSTSWKNFYFIDWPENIRLQDVGGSSVGGNKCVGDAGSTAVPDGVIDSTDAICTLWTSRAGSFAITTIDTATCISHFHSANRGATIQFGGESFPLVAGQGYIVTVGYVAANASLPVNRATLSGSCDPSWPGQRIAPPASGCQPATIILHVPYDSAIRTANEILCGLEGLAWIDGDNDGNPDTCDGGIFDGTTPITVTTYDNDPLTRPETDDRFVRRTVLRTDLGLAFLGMNFALAAGETCMVQVRNAHSPTTWQPMRLGVGGGCR